jgi:hypothetical protein
LFGTPLHEFFVVATQSISRSGYTLLGVLPEFLQFTLAWGVDLFITHDFSPGLPMIGNGAFLLMRAMSCGVSLAITIS